MFSRFFLPLALVFNLATASEVAAEDNSSWSVPPAYQTQITRANQTAFSIKDDKGVERILYDESHAVLILEGKYTAVGWSPISDAAAQNEKLLVKQLGELGFHVVVFRNLGSRQFWDVLRDITANYGYRENSRLFFYYFGHATSLGSEGDPSGLRTFLVPVDAPDPSVSLSLFQRRAIPITQIVENAKQMTLKHAFFAFEACRAGSIISSLSGLPPPNPKGYVLSPAILANTRQFITAGNSTQDVPADGAFTALLAGALTQADFNDDGYITGSEIINFVAQRLPQWARPAYPLNPEYGSIPPAAGGDMIFGPATGQSKTPNSTPRDVIIADPGAPILQRRFRLKKPELTDACTNSNLVRKGTRSGAVGIRGIDISHTRRVKDWKAVANSGVSFVFIKASEGATFKDPAFRENWQGAGEAGLMRGAYHVFHPDVPIEQQISNFVGSFDDLIFGPCDLPPVLDMEQIPVLDMEGHPDRSGAKKFAHDALEILTKWEEIFQSKPIIYTTLSYWQNVLGDPEGFEQFPLWIARYGVKQPALPTTRSRYAFWQDNINRSVPGVDGQVGSSVFNGTAGELRALTR